MQTVPGHTYCLMISSNVTVVPRIPFSNKAVKFTKFENRL